MTKLTKNQKILRWASNQKTRNIGHALTELNQTQESFIFMLNRLKRQGLINFTKIGQYVELHLTQIAYYNRSSLIK